VNMAKSFFILLLLVFAIHAQQEPKKLERVAILNTVGDGDLIYLTERLREIAVNILPKDNYSIMTAQSIIDYLGKDDAVRICKEAQCIAEIGRKIYADYVCQARIGSFGDSLTINMELYSSGNSTLVDSFTGKAKNISGLEVVINEKAPQMFRKMLGVSSVPIIKSGTYAVQTAGGGYEFDGGKSYLVNLSTEPAGAIMSFDGVPAASCPKTPCKATLREGSVRIIAALDQYETADTTVSIKQNNQNINIRLKANFGVLEIKPAYLDDIGKDVPWNLTINDKPYSSWENRLSPGKYKVELSHRCYEALSFEAGINKDKREIFDMSKYIALKNGGLILNVERNGEPVSDPVFVNGRQVGETPFSGAVPLCAKIEIGENRETVDVKLKYNDKVTHTVKNIGEVSGGYLTDSRDGKRYKVVTIGSQMWMAENLNYKASGSKCYDNQENNCQKYGRLYDWETAMKVCPSGWHLPSYAEWTTLINSVGDKAGIKLKSANGWNTVYNYKAGTDAYGFAALPGGCNGPSYEDRFENVGEDGYWWNATENNASTANLWRIHSSFDWVQDKIEFKLRMFSVRCLWDEIDVGYNAYASIDNGLGRTKAEPEKSILPSIAFSLVGAGLIYAGVHFKNKSDEYYKEYSSLSRTGLKQYDDAWDKVEDSGTYSGWSFGLGGLSLSIGIISLILGGF